MYSMSITKQEMSYKNIIKNGYIPGYHSYGYHSYQYNGRFIIDMIINCYILIDSQNSIHVLCHLFEFVSSR